MDEPPELKTSVASSETCAQFAHEPLDFHDKSIRVLRILPGAPKSAIRCEIKLASFKPLTSDKYVCLSYTWGTSKEDHIIYLNGEPFPIRENLWDFLSTARAMHIKDWLWIDAICIAQNNIAEKNHQVGQMSEIYRWAQYVLIWPGKTTACLRYIGTVLAASRCIGRLSSRMGELAVKQGQKLYRRDTIRISNFPYWTRLWIVQEVLLASDVFVILGRRQVHWKTIATCLNAHPIEADPEKKLPPEVTELLHERSIRRGVRSGSYNPDLLCLLRKYGHLECADPRDRVFGLLGLINSANLPPVGYEHDRKSLVFSIIRHYKTLSADERLRIFSTLAYALSLKTDLYCIHRLERHDLEPFRTAAPLEEHGRTHCFLLHVPDGESFDPQETARSVCDFCETRLRDINNLYRSRRWHISFSQPTAHTMWLACKQVDMD